MVFPLARDFARFCIEVLKNRTPRDRAKRGSPASYKIIGGKSVGIFGELAERLNAAVSKTVVAQATGGSNPPLSVFLP